MKVKIIDRVPFEEYKNLFPEGRYKWLNYAKNSLNRIITFAVEDKNKDILGICVFATYRASNSYALLLYVSVLEGQRDQGIATQLIKKAVEQIRTMGYSRISLSLLPEERGDLFERIGFEYYKTEINMVYRGRDLKQSKIGKETENLRAYTARVRTIDQLTLEAKNKFRGIIINQASGVDIEKMNPALSRYYLDKKGDIIGYAAINSGAQGELFVVDFYTVNQDKARNTLPSIILSLLDEYEGALKDDSYIIIPLSSRQNITAMEEGFGAPVATIDLARYFLKNKRGLS